MAGHMRRLAWLLLLAAGLVRAETLPDPTRPPKAYGGEMAAGEAAADSVPQLQSVLLPREGRPLAVIDGQVVRIGDQVAGGRLVRLTETEAVIKGPEGTRRLQLTPEAEIRTLRVRDQNGAKVQKIKARGSHE